MKALFVALLMLIAAAYPSSSTASLPVADNLLTEYMTNPLGVDVPNPGFSWKINSNQRGTLQSAYQIQVASSVEKLHANKPDMWDSRKINSSRCITIPYSGKNLQSRTRYHWRVRVWDQNGRSSVYSKAAYFETAFLDPKEWKAQWVTPAAEGTGNGYHSGFADSTDAVKWVQVDLGRPRSVSSVTLYPAHPYDWRNDEPGFGFPVRYKIEISDTPGFTNPVLAADLTKEDQPNPKNDSVTVPLSRQTARYIRLTTIKLHHPKDTRPLLALAEMAVIDNGKNIALGCAVNAFDSTESNGWSTYRLTDGGLVSREPKSSSPILRREFTLNKQIAKARAYVSGLGYYELHLNGQKVGDRVLDPANANFRKRIYYSTYDVTKLLKQGINCAGAICGQGWWNEPPRFILQLEVTFTDGTNTTIISDDNWKHVQGPIVENSLYNGETYDARLVMPGWDKPGFDDSQWQNVFTPKSRSRLSSQMIQPIKITETLKPKSIATPKPGVYVFDFGQNFSGWCRIKASGPSGTKIQIRHAETLFEDGTINQQNLRSARGTDTYIMRGEGEEAYEPRFTYHGFRYVQVEGYPGVPTLDSIQGRVVHTAFEPRGMFSCSNELLNKIQHACVWGEKTNFHSIPTDCPQRDERQGWMGDAHMSANAMLYNFDMPPAYSKFLQDIKDAQTPEGYIPDTVPHIWGSNPGDPMWSAAYPLILWDMYRHTGDKRLLEQHYNGVKRYVESLRREAKDGIISRNNYGDWIGIVETPKPLISTGSYILVTQLTAQMADELGKTADSIEYDKLVKELAQSFNRKFFDPNKNQYGNGSQFSNTFPLYLGIVPPDKKKAVLENLVKDILENHKGHLSSGFIGTPYLMDVLVREGRSDVAYTIATQETFPGWGYMISKGATTIWELWQYEVGPGMNSHNHPALGFISQWYYSVIAGLSPDPEHPGWEQFTVKPYLLGDLKWAEASVDTLRGQVKSSWKRTETGLKLEVTVPSNSLASVYVPKSGISQLIIREGKAAVWKDGRFVPGAEGIKSGQDSGEWVKFEVGSGVYVFEVTAL